MLTSHRRRAAGSHVLTTSLALAASVALTAPALATADSALEADGTIAVSSLGSTGVAPGSMAGSLESAGSITPEPPTNYEHYVALGDSYAAFGDQTELTGPPFCKRSRTNYPAALRATGRIGDMTDVTCGGADIPSLTGYQTDGIPAQLNALDENTDLVTLSIGGNDVGFADIVDCLVKSGEYRTTPDCRAALDAEVSSDIESTFHSDAEEDVPVATNVNTIYALIAEKSPGATVVATQYLPLMPAEGESCAFTDQLNPDDVEWAREVTERINTAVDEAARRNGHISVLPTDTVDRSACAAPEDRWTDFRGGSPTKAAPFHPTRLGQQAMAEAIAAVI